jgi:hypothetical protein
MKTRMNLPIGFDIKRNGYYYTSAVPDFPKVPMACGSLVITCHLVNLGFPNADKRANPKAGLFRPC